MNLLPYQKKATALCVNFGGRAGCLQHWFVLNERVHIYWSNKIGEKITQYQPVVLLWFVQNQAITYRHLCSVRTAFPDLPITVIADGIGGRMNKQLFIDQRCSPIDISEIECDGIETEIQLAVGIAHQLIKADSV